MEYARSLRHPHQSRRPSWGLADQVRDAEGADKLYDRFVNGGKGDRHRTAEKMVVRMRKNIGLPVEFTLDACRHGGMTEFEEAELTEGQGRALSAHRTKESYAGYAKR